MSTCKTFIVCCMTVSIAGGCSVAGQSFTANSAGSLQANPIVVNAMAHDALANANGDAIQLGAGDRYGNRMYQQFHERALAQQLRQAQPTDVEVHAVDAHRFAEDQ